ncbi:hypothetical protein JXA48_04470 [Candidatus Woesearchaeota archaeon]|nr:hypothetical protein [Candidatus Woesearchaeota archaeon]
MTPFNHIGEQEFETTYLMFGRNDSELVGIKNWSSGQNRVQRFKLNSAGKLKPIGESILNEDGRTVDGLVMAGNHHFIVTERGNEPYGGVIQYYEFTDGGVKKSYGPYPTRNFIDSPSMSKGFLMGDTVVDNHGTFLSIYNLNMQPQVMFTKKMPSFRKAIWLNSVSGILTIGDSLGVYNWNPEDFDLNKFDCSLSETINNHLNQDRKFNRSIGSVLQTPDNKLIFGVRAYDNSPGVHGAKCSLVFTKDYVSSLLGPAKVSDDLISDVQEFDSANNLILSPSGKLLVSYGTSAGINIYKRD